MYCMHSTVQFHKFIQLWILTLCTLALLFSSKDQIMLLLLFFSSGTCGEQHINTKTRALRWNIRSVAVRIDITIIILVIVVIFIVFNGCLIPPVQTVISRGMRHCNGGWFSHRNIAGFGIGLCIHRTPTPLLRQEREADRSSQSQVYHLLWSNQHHWDHAL